MVKISSTYIGVAGGKLGKGVYYTRKGVTVARDYVVPRDPKTPKQLNKRQRFSECEGFCQHITADFKDYWMTELYNQTKFNSLMSFTLDHAVVLVGDVWEMDWSKVRFASGNLWGIVSKGVMNLSGQTIEMSWEDNSGMGYGKTDDEFACMFVNLTAYERKQGQETTVKIRKTTSKRSDASCIYDLPKDWAGAEVAVYGCFKSADGKAVTDTCYFGRITLQMQEPSLKTQDPCPKLQISSPKIQEPSYTVQDEDNKPPGMDEYEYYTILL